MPHPAPSKDRTVLIIVIVVVLVVLVPIVLAGALYLMVSGLIGAPGGGPGTSKPTIVMTSTKTSTGADITVSITPSTNPSNFKVNIENVGNTTFGTAVNLPPTASQPSSTITVGTNQLTVTWQNPSGNGHVSTGDHFVVRYTNGIPTTQQWSLILIWSDGSTLSTVSWLS